MADRLSHLLRRLADWIDAHLIVSAGRMHSSELDGIQHRQRDVFHLAIGPVAILIDLPGRRPRPPIRPVADEPIGLSPDFFARPFDAR